MPTSVKGENLSKFLQRLLKRGKKCQSIDGTISFITFLKKYKKQKLISYLNKRDERGRTALHMAASRGHLGIIKSLIKQP